jgi:hypothetical protein
MPPKVLGRSQSVFGAYDVETDRGVLPMTRDALVLNGFGAQVKALEGSVPEAQQFGVLDDYAATRPRDERVVDIDASRIRPDTDAEVAQMDRDWQRTRSRVIAAGGDISGPPPRGGWDQWLANNTGPIEGRPVTGGADASRGAVASRPAQRSHKV